MYLLILSFENINKLKLFFECGIPMPQDTGTPSLLQLQIFIVWIISVLQNVPPTKGYRKETPSALHYMQQTVRFGYALCMHIEIAHWKRTLKTYAALQAARVCSAVLNRADMTRVLLHNESACHCSLPFAVHAWFKLYHILSLTLVY
jgi:hypothetical protein